MQVAVRFLGISADLITRSHTVLTAAQPWYKPEAFGKGSPMQVAEAVATSPLVLRLLPLCASVLSEGEWVAPIRVRVRVTKVSG